VSGTTVGAVTCPPAKKKRELEQTVVKQELVFKRDAIEMETVFKTKREIIQFMSSFSPSLLKSANDN